ncbi:MAG: hypothetical protein WAN32_01385, partial [Candidatus Acidiferrum sp.]
MSDPHCEEISAEYAFRSLDDKPVLQGPYIPGNLDVRRAALALRCYPPLVKQKVGVASVCAI